MKGTYCLVLDLPDEARIRVGALGMQRFPSGTYVYVGSALSGIEQRISRHVRKAKKKRWHIDYLLDKANLLSTIAIPSQSKDTECEVARALLKSDGAFTVISGFGSSDCHCESHLIHFGGDDPVWVTENVARTVAMLSCVYPTRTGAGRE